MNLNDLFDKLNISRERQRFYIALATFVISVVVLIVVLNGNWNILLAIFWIPVALVTLGMLVWFLTRFAEATTPALGKGNVIHFERCQVQIGYKYYGWLFTSVSVYEGRLVIKGVDQVTFVPQDIWNLKLVRVFLKSAILVQHTRADVLRPVFLLSWNSAKLKESIESGLHLHEMQNYGKEPTASNVPEGEQKERRKYSWLQ